MKKIFFITLLFIFYIFINATSYSKTILEELDNNFFRLHIIANSDSEEDQHLKLIIRDYVINYINNRDIKSYSKEETITKIENNQEELKELILNIIHENNFDYDVKLSIGNFYFPTKNYNNISLPAGKYDALKIELGKAEGKNWWCSLYPPLCFTNNSSGKLEKEDEDQLKENLSDECFSIVKNDSSTIKIKFKILELLNL